MSAPSGRLLLVPNTLDLGAPEASPVSAVLAAAALAEAARIQHWVAENAKAARALLSRIGREHALSVPLQAMQITELPRPPKGRPMSQPPNLAPLLAPVLAGHDLGLVSDAGLPGVADPGAELVAAAHARGVAVWPLAGPSSITLAVAASGLHGQSFAFVGYLPVDAAARTQRVRELQERSRRERQSQFAIETPYRNAALLRALLEALAPSTRLSIACGLTLAGGWCRTQTVSAWRETPTPFGEPHVPAVFGWLAAP